MPEGFFSLADFTGVPVGQEPPEESQEETPPCGFYGLLDFTGVPCGQPQDPTPESVPPCGFLGMLDFTGVPCGQPPNTRLGKGRGIAAGRRHVAQRASQIHYQTLLDQLAQNHQQEVILRLTQRVLKQHLEYEQALFEHKKNITLSVLLSEV